MIRTPNSKEERIDYSSSVKLWREGRYVYKVDPVRLGPDWREKMNKMIFRPPVLFERFIENGYVTRYLDGTDAHGNKPFSNTGKSGKSILNFEQKLDVLRIFERAKECGEMFGFTFGDITCGNMMTGNELNPNGVWLIDYDVIVDYPLSDDYIRIWENTLRIIFG